jgi:dipeptidyl aminopeptidase/acylaminoacyl peptidase
MVLIVGFLLTVSVSPFFGNGIEKTGKKWQWKVDDLITTDRVSAYRLSEDGKTLVWAVRKWNLKDHKTYNILYLTHLDTKKKDKPGKIRLTHGEDSFSSIQWVPGENKISFKTSRKFEKTKPGNLWVMNLEGGEPHPVTSFEDGIMQYQWLDKDNILFVAREAKTLYETKQKERKDTSELVEDEDHRIITRLFKHNLKTKKTVRLTDNIKPLSYFILSYDKKKAIYAVSMSLRWVQDQEIRPKYYLMDLEKKDAKAKEILGDPALKPVGSFYWARDNSGFYTSMYHTQQPKYTFGAIRKIHYYSLADGTLKEVDSKMDRTASRVIVTNDGLILGHANGVHLKYARYFKKGDTWIRKWIGGDIHKNISSVRLAENGRTMIYYYSTASLPGRYYLAELKGERFVKSFEVMDIDSPLFERPMGKTEVLTWKGAKDETVEGLLTYPPNYEKGKKYPLIVMIHGGPHGADMDFFSNSWSRPVHILAERGAFVFRVNYHGSSNYGLEFGESIAEHYYEYEIPDIENGVDLLIAKGLVDKDKLGVIGWSNGSILGIQLTVLTDRYKAASLGAGDVNWISDYGNCAFGVSFDNFYFGGPPWEKLEHYIEKSPLFKLKKVAPPTLIFHGDKGLNVPYGQGKEFYRALQVIGKVPVRFISFPGEFHGPRKLGHLRRKVEEDLRWFDKYLFKTYKEKNESLKKGSPLEKLDTYLKIAKVKGLYGIEKNGVLVPEVVEYKKKKIGRFEVTRAQWAAFDTSYTVEDGTGNWPVTGISFEQAKEYIQWLNEKTGETYRLPNPDDVKSLYSSRSGNTFDYWAGYSLSPDDYKNLFKELKKYKAKPVLLKPVGSFKAKGDNPVFDLGGNAAEWTETKEGKGKACGGSADCPEDVKTDITPDANYTGFRLVKGVKETETKEKK